MQLLIKALFLSCLATVPLMPLIPKKPDSIVTTFKRNIGNFLCHWITSDDVSDETATFTQDLLKKIDPEQKITRIQKFNALGEYLFGRNNIIAIPFLNYVILNTKSLKKLPEETQRFVIGRSLYSMTHAKEYFAYKILLPLLYDVLFQVNESPAVKEAFTHLRPSNLLRAGLTPAFSTENASFVEFDQTYQATKTAGRHIIYHILATLHSAYASRHLEWEADVQTAKILNCAKGGIDFFKNYQEFKGDGTFIGGVTAHIPLFEWLNRGTFALLEKFAPQITNINSKIDLYGITFAQPRGAHFLSQLKELTPGQIVPYSNSLTHEMSRIPVLNYFCHSASTGNRIAALEKLIQKPNNYERL